MSAYVAGNSGSGSTHTDKVISKKATKAVVKPALVAKPKKATGKKAGK